MTKIAIIDPTTNIVENVIVARQGFSVPNKTVVHTDSAGIGDIYHPESGEFEHTEPLPREITAEEVIAERERRLVEGFDYDFGDQRGVHHIGTTREDMVGWEEVTKLSNALINVGDTETLITIVTETGGCSVTAMEWQYILLAAGTFRQPIWQASFLLQQTDPIPLDYTDDKWWN